MNNDKLTPNQQQLQEIGVKLHQIRVEQNISLDDVAAKTSISHRLLRAIEMGDCAELPEPFYIQALVKKYAGAVGAKNIVFTTVDSQPSASKTNSAPRRQHRLNFQLRSQHLYLLYILLVVISVRGITSLVERPVVIERSPVDNGDLIPDKPTPNTTQAIQPQPASQLVSQSNSAESVSVGVNLQERCWLKVMVDGNVAFEGTLPQGTKRQWSGQKEVTIRAGNAGGVVISFNNQQQQILGAPGQVEEITYTLN